MAITFEKKDDTIKIVFVIFFLVVLSAVGGYFAWKFFLVDNNPEAPGNTSTIKIKSEVFNDQRIGSLDLFPQIPAPTIDTSAGVRKNPFAEMIQTTTEVEKVTVPVNAAN